MGLVNMFCDGVYKDLLHTTLGFLELKETVGMASVCKRLGPIAREVSKQQAYIKERSALAQKMRFYLEITGEELSEYCGEIDKTWHLYSAKKITRLFQELIMTRCEVLFCSRWTLDADFLGPNGQLSSSCSKDRDRIRDCLRAAGKVAQARIVEITLERINKVAGKGFLNFMPSADRNTYLWEKKSYFSFPTSLFGFTFDDDIGMYNAMGNTFCFPLEGRLLEVYVLPSEDENWPPIVPKSQSFEHYAFNYYIPEMIGDTKTFVRCCEIQDKKA